MLKVSVVGETVQEGFVARIAKLRTYRIGVVFLVVSFTIFAIKRTTRGAKGAAFGIVWVAKYDDQGFHPFFRSLLVSTIVVEEGL